MNILTKLTVVAMLIWGLAGSAGAQGTPDQAIRDVISAQIEAFQGDDLDTAFSFAAPNIKQMFTTPERFGQMVRQGYPMVWRPGSVKFLWLENRDGTPVQRVFITDRDGRSYIASYAMVMTDAGWQIEGVWIEAATAASA